MKQAAPPPARPALNEATQDSVAVSKEYPDDLILAFAEIVRRPTWPDSPREALAYGYGRMSLNALARPDLPFAATDMHLARLARAVRAGRLSFKNSDSLLSSIDRALAGDAAAYAYLERWLERRPDLKRKVNEAYREVAA